MRLKAYILTLLFLLGSNGISIDIATCCESLSGISIGFQSNESQQACESCTSCVSKTKSSCCDSFQINTVINPVLYAASTKKVKLNDFKVKHIDFYSSSVRVVNSIINENHFNSQYSEPLNGVPILLKKRVLQIW